MSDGPDRAPHGCQDGGQGPRRGDSRPVLAGVLFGLLSFKPQLGLLIPVVLAAARLWRPFISAAATVLLLTASSLTVFGPEAWELYFTQAVLPILALGADANGLPVGPVLLVAFFLLIPARAKGWLQIQAGAAAPVGTRS